MTPLEKLDRGFGISAEGILEISPNSGQTKRSVVRLFRNLVAQGRVPAEHIARVGHTTLYPAWAVRRYVLGELTAVPPVDEFGCVAENGAA